MGGCFEGMVQGECQVPVCVQWPAECAVARVEHAIFSSTESFPEFQMARFPSGWQAQPSGLAQVLPSLGFCSQALGDGPLCIQTGVRLKA